MKLTKAQRLFVAVGQVQHELMLQKAYYAPWDDYKEESSKAIKKYKARRKELIREALRAYELEIGEAFSDGHALMRAISEEAPMVIEDEGQTIIF